MDNQMYTRLKELRLSGMINSFELRLQEARANKLDYNEFLELLIYDEIAVRKDRKIDRMLKKAAFSNLKTLEHFDWQFNANLDRKMFYELATSKFIREAKDVLLIGPPGTGENASSTGDRL